MDLQDFKKKHCPKRPKSKIAPYVNELKILQQDGYTLVQLQQYLKSKGVEIAIQNIWAFLKRSEGKALKPAGESQEKAGKNGLRNTKVQTEEPGEPVGEDTGSHRPTTLDAIIGTTPDLAALSKMAKGKRGKK